MNDQMTFEDAELAEIEARIDELQRKVSDGLRHFHNFAIDHHFLADENRILTGEERAEWQALHRRMWQIRDKRLLRRLAELDGGV